MRKFRHFMDQKINQLIMKMIVGCSHIAYDKSHKILQLSNNTVRLLCLCDVTTHPLQTSLCFDNIHFLKGRNVKQLLLFVAIY